MQTKRAKHIIDILLGIGLLLLMSYQVVGESGHEWTGISMTLLMILHQMLNQKWYAALFKGRYTPLRIAQTLINATLVITPMRSRRTISTIPCWKPGPVATDRPRWM